MATSLSSPTAVCDPISRSTSSSHRHDVLGLEQVVLVSASQGSLSGNVTPSSFQGESHAHSSMVTDTIVVSNTIGLVFQHQGVPQCSPITAGARQDSFFAPLAFHQPYTFGFSNGHLLYLVWCVRCQIFIEISQSTRRRYKTV